MAQDNLTENTLTPDQLVAYVERINARAGAALAQQQSAQRDLLIRCRDVLTACLNEREADLSRPQRYSVINRLIRDISALV
jgi:hypothetical protein